MCGSGIDLSREAIKMAEKKKLPRIDLVETDYLKYEPATRPALIFMLNVLEHVTNDRAFLLRAADLLPHDGHLIIATPMFQRAFGFADVNAGHVRRYDYAELVQKLSDAGFVVDEIMSVGFPVNRCYTWLFNFLNRHRSGEVRMEKTLESGIRTRQGYYGGFYDSIAPIAFPMLTLLIQIDRLFIRTRWGNNSIVFARKRTSPS